MAWTRYPSLTRCETSIFGVTTFCQIVTLITSDLDLTDDLSRCSSPIIEIDVVAQYSHRLPVLYGTFLIARKQLSSSTAHSLASI